MVARKLSILISFALILCLCCCAKTNTQDDETHTNLPAFQDHRDTDDVGIMINAYQKPFDEGYEYEVIGTDGVSLFYSKKKPKPMGTTLIESFIVSIPRESAVETILLDTSYEGLYYVNEEIVTTEGIFWSLYDASGCCIQFYDFNNQDIIQIKHIPEAKNIVLNADNRFLIWVEWEIVDDEESPYLLGKLYTFDVLTKEVKMVSDKVYSISPYARFPVNGGKCAFSTIDQDSKKICRYDLDLMNVTDSFEVEIQDPANIMTANDRIIFSNGILDGLKPLDIYIYDCSSGEMIKVHSITEDHNIFSFHLIGDNLVINDDHIETDNATASLIFRKLDQLTDYEAVSIPEGYFVFGKVIDGHYYIVEDLAHSIVYFCEII